MSRPTLYSEVFTELQGKVDEVYVYFQERMGITHGDQPVDLAIDEGTAVRYLAKAISDTLKAQKGE